MQTVFTAMLAWAGVGSWALALAIWAHPADPRWTEFDQVGWPLAIPVAFAWACSWPLLFPLLIPPRRGRHR